MSTNWWKWSDVGSRPRGEGQGGGLFLGMGTKGRAAGLVVYFGLFIMPMGP